jgi:RNA polymerase sigma factor (sigma-70 family)
MASLTRDLRHVLAVAFRRPDADAELLARFVAARDEAAFAEIVHRHGPAVLRVCRSLLTSADADDAFQATFFVLARRAESLREVRSLGGWLVGVAGRVARQLRRSGWRRAVVENEYRPHDSVDLNTDQNLKDLNEELTQLPNRYRDPIVLCFLQDRTQVEAAAELGQSVRTLRRRLEKAKALLRLRLVRRGVAPAILVPTTPLMISSAAAARTATAAVQFLAGGVRSPAATLAKGVGMTSLIKFKVAAGLCAVVGTLTAIGMAQDNSKPTSIPSPPKAADHPVARTAPVADGGAVLLGGLAQAGTSFTEESTRGITVSAANLTLARIIRREAEHHLDALSTQWLGAVPNKLGYKLHIEVNLNGNPDGTTSLKFTPDYKMVTDARVTVSGPLESMLYDQLPCEVAHVVLAAHFTSKLPKWADDGLALTTTSPEHQAKAHAAIRQYVDGGKGYRLKALFAMKEYPEAKSDWAVFATQATSVVRFLMTRKVRDDFTVTVTTGTTNGSKTWRVPNEPQAMFTQFLQIGVDKNDWDRAVNSVFDFKNVDAVEEAWIKWLYSPDAIVGLTAVPPPPPLPADPARIPPVNLGK